MAARQRPTARATPEAAATTVARDPPGAPVERNEGSWDALPRMAPVHRRPPPAGHAPVVGPVLVPPVGRAPLAAKSTALVTSETGTTDEAAEVTLTRDILKVLSSDGGATPVRLALRGSPDGAPSVSVDWIRLVLAPVLAAVGVEVAVTTPADQAEAAIPVRAVNVNVRLVGRSPRQLTAVNWVTSTTPTGIVGRVWVAGLPRSVATRMLDAAQWRLKRELHHNLWAALGRWEGVVVDEVGGAAGAAAPFDEAGHADGVRRRGGRARFDRRGRRHGSGDSGDGGVLYGRGGCGIAPDGVGCGITLAVTAADGRVVGVTAGGAPSVRAEVVGARAAAALAADLSAGAAADARTAAAVVAVLGAAAGASAVRLSGSPPMVGVREAVAAAAAAGVDTRVAWEGDGWVLRVVGVGVVFGSDAGRRACDCSSPE